MSQTGVANTQPSMEQPDNVTFVLVHCAFGGGWAWKYVAPLLRQRGHRVYAPSLTGLGERVHLGGPEINLDTHIEDIVNLLISEDLRLGAETCPSAFADQARLEQPMPTSSP